MNNTKSMKVSVNGKKYFISGIQKYTSHKEILCAIAKVTRSAYNNIERAEGKSSKALYSVNTIQSNVNTNELNQLKRDCKTYRNKSIEIFNTSTKDTGIISKECKKKRYKERSIQSSQNKHRSTEEKHSKLNNQTENDNKPAGERKHKNSKTKSGENSNSVYIVKVADNFQNKNLKRHKLRRSRKHRKKSFEKNEEDFTPVLSAIDHSQKGNPSKADLKPKKKTDWMNDFKNSTHVYYVDGKEFLEGDQTMTADTFLNGGADKDSGLPSPDFNSSESQDTDHVKGKSLVVSHINIEQLFLAQLASIEKELNKSTDIGKQNCNQNKTFHKNSNGDEKTESLHNINSEQNINQTNFAELSLQINTDNTFNQRNQKDSANISSKYQSSEQLLARDSLVVDPCEDYLLNIEPSFNLRKSLDNLLDFNKNIVGHTDQTKNTLYNSQPFSEKTTLSEKNKVYDRKRIIKTDISPPILMSPGAIRKQKSLRKLQAVLGEDVASTIFQTADTSRSKDTRNSEKTNKKKLKEKRVKKSKPAKEKCNEPEYIAKDLFFEKPTELLEYNVFRKKEKPKKLLINKISKPQIVAKLKKDFIKVETLKELSIVSKDVEGVSDCLDNTKANFLTSQARQNQTSDERKENIIFDTCSNKSKENASESKCEEMCVESNSGSANGFDKPSVGIDNPVSMSFEEPIDERSILEQQFIEVSFSLLYIEEQNLDLNLIISHLTEELELINEVEEQNLDEIEGFILKELKDVISLLRSVTDLTTYQRQEMVTNIKLLDQLDQDLKTKKAALENLRSGSWRTNAYCAPRSLIKRSKKKMGPGLYDKKFSFV